VDIPVAAEKSRRSDSSPSAFRQTARDGAHYLTHGHRLLASYLTSGTCRLAGRLTSDLPLRLALQLPVHLSAPAQGTTGRHRRLSSKGYGHRSAYSAISSGDDPNLPDQFPCRCRRLTISAGESSCRTVPGWFCCSSGKGGLGPGSRGSFGIATPLGERVSRAMLTA